MIHPNKNVRLVSEFLNEFSDPDDRALAVTIAIEYAKDFECKSVEEALNAAREDFKEDGPVEEPKA